MQSNAPKHSDFDAAVAAFASPVGRAAAARWVFRANSRAGYEPQFVQNTGHAHTRDVVALLRAARAMPWRRLLLMEDDFEAPISQRRFFFLLLFVPAATSSSWPRGREGLLVLGR